MFFEGLGACGFLWYGAGLLHTFLLASVPFVGMSWSCIRKVFDPDIYDILYNTALIMHKVI